MHNPVYVKSRIEQTLKEIEKTRNELAQIEEYLKKSKSTMGHISRFVGQTIKFVKLNVIKRVWFYKLVAKFWPQSKLGQNINEHSQKMRSIISDCDILSQTMLRPWERCSIDQKPALLRKYLEDLNNELAELRYLAKIEQLDNEDKILPLKDYKILYNLSTPEAIQALMEEKGIDSFPSSLPDK